MSRFFNQFLYASGCFYELAKGLIFFVVFLGLFTAFVATINIVNGRSMFPNFEDGQLIIIDRLSYRWRLPERGDAVTLRFPGDPDKVKYIKRIIGLPGEQVALGDDILLINGQPLLEDYIPAEFTTGQTGQYKNWQLGPDEYFLVGDNRENSSDSRIYGPVERRFLIGRALAVIWPIKTIGFVPPVFYRPQK
ncbi:MAG: signal peptidase I [Candidatus Berkelbacteria bacterium Gr01-1014_85]|uniref:Signal peptidase I n=1 Tax=Candidatus Berkelbacteria bacterium Gr01-1014_85 TaxID=2017150 RepID=A0A554JDJ5_9BACT|nr:MAG: signal peptidase I [Candidatus Berkelbacteria bacterium Gr01-1014_85]